MGTTWPHLFLSLCNSINYQMVFQHNDVCSYQVLNSGPWVSGVFFWGGGGGGGSGMYFQPHIKKKDKISCPKVFGLNSSMM